VCLTNSAVRHEGEWGSGCTDPRFLDLGTSWSTGRVNPEERAPGTHWIGGLVGPRAALDAPGTHTPTLGRPACRQSLYRLRYP
jgi:hypothetical protein